MEKTVGIISETRLEIERKITDLYSKVPGFEFLNSSDDYHAFYKHRLAANRARATSVSDGAGAAKRSHHGDSQTYMLKKVAPMPRKFTCRVAEGITSKELDTIKLAAQFWALHGRSFWEGCSERKNKDPQFEFMMKPGDGRFDLFGRLVEANMEATCRPYYLKEKLRKNPTTDMETVLENCFHRLQWDRFSKKAREEERASEPKRTPLSLAQGHLCGMAYMALDPPPKPDPKRQKIDESDLVPEGQFLAQNPPGSATVWVFFPEVSGGLYSKIIMPSLSEKVASLKDKLSDETTVPASKLKLSGKSGILKDNMSLAYYNVGAQDILTCLY